MQTVTRPKIQITVIATGSHFEFANLPNDKEDAFHLAIRQAYIGKYLK